METSCYHCGKTILFGRSHTHHRGVAGGRWKKRAPKTQRIFKVNFVRATIIENGKEKRVKLCAKCVKRIKKDIADGKKPFLTIKKFAKTNQKEEKKDEKTPKQ
ncbi:MAG: L28 family ribosomal protein [Microgenomates group bacterium]